MQHYWKFTCTAFGLLFTAACATAPAPRAELTRATAELTAAEALEAEEIPQAKLHLQLAREQLALAERMIEAGEHEEARLAIWRASADAELARALAVEERTREEADEAQARLDGLRREAM